MEVFSTVVNQLDALIWSMALVGLCLGAGFYLSLRLGFPQVRLIVDMLRLLFGDKKSEHGISSSYNKFCKQDIRLVYKAYFSFYN